MQNIWGKEMRAMKDDRFLKFTLSLSRMNKKVQAVKTAGMGMVGLKAAHTAVLYALSGHSEGLQFAEVAAACDLDPALISRTFSELIAAGMVEKQGEPGRYRARYVLTEQGSLQTAKIRQVIGLVQENADKNIAPEDLQTFYRVLEQLLNNFEEMSEHYDTVFESRHAAGNWTICGKCCRATAMRLQNGDEKWMLCRNFWNIRLPMTTEVIPGSN